MSLPERKRWNMDRHMARWIMHWGHDYSLNALAIIMPGVTAADVERLVRETREDGIVFRLTTPLPAKIDNTMSWARAIKEKQATEAAKAAAKKRWTTLKQEIIAGALKPRRVDHLIRTYGFDALEQFE